jgi:hypothetical protein
MSYNDVLVIARWGWLGLSLFGAGFYLWLLLRATGDLNVRKTMKNSPRSSILFAWQRVAFDSTLFVTMLVDAVLAAASFEPGRGPYIVAGLVLDKLILVALGRYLVWNRTETGEAGTLEFDVNDLGGPRMDVIDKYEKTRELH